MGTDRDVVSTNNFSLDCMLVIVPVFQTARSEV